MEYFVQIQVESVSLRLKRRHPFRTAHTGRLSKLIYPGEMVA